MADTKLLSDALDVLWTHATEAAKEHSFVAISKLRLVTGYDADASYVDHVYGLEDWARNELNRISPQGAVGLSVLPDKDAKYAFALVALRQQCRRWSSLNRSSNVLQFFRPSVTS